MKYDDRGRVYQTITYGVDPSTETPTGSSLTDNLWYDQADNIIQRQPEGVMTQITMTYDSLGRLTTETNPLSAMTSYTYDAASNRISLTDADNNTTTWAYDGIGRVITETNALDDSRLFEYGLSGMLFQQTDRNGRIIDFTYDDAGRVTEERWLNGTSVVNTITTTYDADGHVDSISDLNATYAYAYNGLGQLIEIDNEGTPGAPHVVLQADLNRLGQRTQLAATIDSTPDFQNSWQYDSLGRPHQLTQTGQTGGNTVSPKRVNFDYSVIGGFGQLAHYRDLAGSSLVATSDYSYDGYGRLTELAYSQGATALSAYSRTFDGNRWVNTATTPDGTADYNYDNAGQLTTADYSFQTDESYSYDLTGNRTNTGYDTGDNNQLLSDGTHTYTYDPEGNRTKRITTATSDYIEYTWDHRNRLTGVTFRDSANVLIKQVTYSYDPYNYRISKLVDTTEEYFVFDQGVKDGLDDCLLVFDAAGTLQRRYLQGPMVDQPLAEDNSAGEVLWLFADAIGTIHDLAVCDTTTSVTGIVNHLSYDSFGSITAQSDSTVGTRYGFTARDWDPDVLLWWYRARWYDSNVGRFVSEDPIGFSDSINLYVYVQSNPILLVDPSGTTLIDCDCSCATLNIPVQTRRNTVTTDCDNNGDRCCQRACMSQSDANKSCVSQGPGAWKLTKAQPDKDAPFWCCSTSACKSNCSDFLEKCILTCFTVCVLERKVYWACVQGCHAICTTVWAICSRECLLCNKP